MAVLRLSDDALEPYHRMAAEFKQPIEGLIERQLTRFSAFAPTVRIVPLAREPLQAIETLLGGGQIQSGPALVERMKAYASVHLGKIEIPLSAAQKAEIAHRAQKQGKSPDQVVQEIVSVILDQMFDAVTPFR